MGKIQQYINWIQICRRNKAGRAGFAMSKMVARACNLPKQISSSVLQNLPQFWCVAEFSLHLCSFACFYLHHSLISFLLIFILISVFSDSSTVIYSCPQTSSFFMCVVEPGVMHWCGFWMLPFLFQHLSFHLVCFCLDCEYHVIRRGDIYK